MLLLFYHCLSYRLLVRRFLFLFFEGFLLDLLLRIDLNNFLLFWFLGFILLGFGFLNPKKLFIVNTTTLKKLQSILMKLFLPNLFSNLKYLLVQKMLTTLTHQHINQFIVLLHHFSIDVGLRSVHTKLIK